MPSQNALICRACAIRLAPLPYRLRFVILSASREDIGEKRVNKALETAQDTNTAGRIDWRKKMSDNVAYALLVYTALQIFVTIHALKDGANSIMPYFALVVLVAAIIPACRKFERRWTVLDDEAAQDLAMKPAFRRDQVMLWIMAIALPLLLTGAFKLVTSLT